MKKYDYWRISIQFGIQKKWLLAMKTFVILLLAFNLSLSASVLSQTRITLSLKNVSFIELIQEIESKTDLGFIYNQNDIKDIDEISLEVADISVEDVLEIVLVNSDLEYEIDREIIIIRPAKITHDQKKKQEKKIIKGKVTNKDGVALPGVSVFIKGTTTGVATNVDGEYQLEVEKSNVVLVFSFVGMIPQEVKYTGQAVQNVTLTANTEQMEEVVVTGYQTISKERTTGSFVVINSKKMEDKLDNDLAVKLEGAVAGLVLFDGVATIRGLSTFNAGSEPLYVVDGFPVSSIDQVNTNDIQNISVLKDAAAASIWGARASNGVIVVTTKRGKQSKGTWNYRFNYKIGEKRDFSYLKHLNAKEMVDFEVENFDKKDIPWEQIQMFRMLYTKVDEILYNVKRGIITQEEADKKLNVLRNSDNASQIEDLFLENPTIQEHQLSYIGGNNSHKYYTSLNYRKEKDYIKNDTESVMFTLNDDFQIWENLKLNVGTVFNLKKWNSSNISNRWLGIYTKPYEQFIDEKGNASAITHPKKNKEEIERLKRVGLYDETYIPLNDMKMYDNSSEDTYTRLSVGLNYEIIKGLNFDLKYQLERTNSVKKYFADENSYEVRKMINDFAQIDEDTGEITYNIPQGGRYSETRGTGRDYNIRAQLNFNKTFDDHDLIALAGAEKSENSYNSNKIEKFGFNPQSLHYVALDLDKLRSGIENPQSGRSQEQYDEHGTNFFSDIKNRFVSFYSNFAYNYKRKYNLTASARIDQTNLFGTDKKYKYKPLWSVGLGWNISEESFFKSEIVNRLQLRYTYGTNGNVASQNGPYIVLETGNNSLINEEYNEIISPRNDKLRWESTSTHNIGIELEILDNKVSGSIELYKRRSKDLLGMVPLNPLVGFSSAMINTGNIDNDGVEILLNTKNISSKDFEWTTGFNFAYNKSKVKNVNSVDNSSYWRVARAVDIEGYAAKSLFSYRWGGLNNQGVPQVYNIDGDLVADEEMNDLDALVHAGTIIPVFSGGITNNLRYKNWSMSFLFIYNGGNKMRDDVASPYRVNHVDIVKRWKKAGDETKTNIPVYDPQSANNRLRGDFWQYSDYNILDASYLKLRYVTLSYNLPENLTCKLKLQQVKFNLQAKNLFYWSANNEGIDPESHNLYSGVRRFPIARTYTLGLNITL